MKDMQLYFNRFRNDSCIQMDKLIRFYRNTVCSGLYRMQYREYDGQVPVLDKSRKSYKKLLRLLVNNVIEQCFDSQTGYFRSPINFRYSYNSLPCDTYELISRSFIGAIYLLTDGNDPAISKVYLDTLRKGIHSASPFYWGHLNRQRIVENASIAVGFLLYPDLFWDALSNEEKGEMICYYKETAQLETYHNNWMWFRLFHYVFLEHFEGSNQEAHIRALFDRISALYSGDGWYNDKGPYPGHAFDEYNGCTYHYYGPLFYLISDSRYDDLKSIIKERLKIFCRNTLPLFNTSEMPVFWGRSMVHRFANTACFGLGVKMGVIPEDQYEIVKAKLTGTINAFLQNRALDHRGLLSSGYCEPIPRMLEGYCGIGSSYWALKAFTVLLLNEDHPFWQTKILSESDGIRSEKITLRSIGVHIENNGAGESILLNGGIFTTKWDPRKYNAFAYSNKFPVVLDDNHMSNGFLFMYRGKQQTRDQIENIRTYESEIYVEWAVRSIPGLRAFTRIVPLTHGYCLVHHIESPELISFVYSGFAIPRDKVQKVMFRPEGIILQNTVYAAGLNVLSDIECLYGCKHISGKKSVVNNRTILPWCRSSLQPGINQIVTCAQGLTGSVSGLSKIHQCDGYLIITNSNPNTRQLIKISSMYPEIPEKQHVAAIHTQE